MQSVANLFHETQSVVAWVSQILEEISQSLIIGTVLLVFIHNPKSL